mmetsp:Transcript_35600/g.87569  ORF Transcript_35600/g.87569 Transcript_35600/m.87569 type:complete len:165 (+) Transcript_35600:862-1356(+)
MPGYAGGNTPNPTYKQVCRGGTGHAECVQVTYDTSKASLADIYDLFFVAHDPTQVNRQGADVGRHYRSIILYEDEEQKEEALKAIERASEEYKDKKLFGIIPVESKIATEVAPLDTFWPAESYHKDYFLNNQNMPYCAINIGPKLRSFKVRSKISAIGPADDVQ